MRLPFLRSKDPVAERGPRNPVADDSAALEAARTRARRRLIGALVLLVAGVIGFPLLFETQPRPLPVDTPIEVRPRDLIAAPAPAPSPPVVPAPPPDAGAEMAAAPATTDAVRPDEPALGAASAPAASPPPPTAGSAPLAPPPTVSAEASAKPSAQVAAAAPAPRPDDGARARALLEGAGTPDPASSRFVVQVGAYSDPVALRDARQRVERLGLKTYTQVVETAAGKRTRVRIGPFASRQEADTAAARIKGAGMPANVLAL